MEKQVLIIAGASGCGKSSAAGKIEQQIQMLYLDVGDISKQMLQKKSLSKQQVRLKASNLIKLKRVELIDSGVSFIYETTLTESSEIDFVEYAKQQGYEIIFIYIGTDTPQINIRRLEKLVVEGENVNEDLITETYRCSMTYVKQMLRLVDVAYILDNSVDNGQAEICLAKMCERTTVVNEEHKWVRDYCI